MSHRFPRATSAELIQFLCDHGFQELRVRGSHHTLKRGVAMTVVPHPADISIGLLRSILRQSGLSTAQYRQWWES